MRQSTEAALAAWGSGRVDAIVLTGQMPTLVALSSSGDVLGAAVTWQDSRADALVERFLRPDQARRLYELSGTPIDGRYVIPMHLRRTHDSSYEPALLLSAKDFVFFALTGVAATDPSTASGFANYDLESRDWSAELNELWNLDPALLPEVVDANFTAPLSAAGAGLLAGVSLGTPVVVGAADSVVRAPLRHLDLRRRRVDHRRLLDSDLVVDSPPRPPLRPPADYAPGRRFAHWSRDGTCSRAVRRSSG
jgi:xylulokinase